MTPGLTHVGVMNFDLTPLGERRLRLPLQRKVKQLQRPWQRAASVSETVSHCFIWGSSLQQTEEPSRRPRPQSGAPAILQPANQNGTKRGPLSSSSSGRIAVRRKRLSTRPLQRRNPQRQLAQKSDDFKLVRWDGTTPTTAQSAGESAGWDRLFIGGSAELVEKQSFQTTEATLNSALSVPCFFASVDSGSGDIVRLQIDSANAEQDVASTTRSATRSTPDSSAKSNASISKSADLRVGAVKRPASACAGFSIQNTQTCTLRGDEVTRPQTAGPRSPSRPHDSAAPVSGVKKSDSNVGITTETACATASQEGCETGSSIGGRVSVAVTLPLLIEADGTDDARFRPGSGSRSKLRTGFDMGMAVIAGSPTLLVRTEQADASISEKKEQRGEEERPKEEPTAAGASKQSTLVHSPSPPIGVLGYFAPEEGRQHHQNHASLNGKALVGSRSRSAPSSRPVPAAALLPGQPRYGVSHPLSPTSVGSPPRRHRNSNWGEEGMRLALEEQEKSRSTVPFVVSSTMLGWKLSTRGRKKSLEAALRSTSYSDHHPIPLYGFRYENCSGEDDAGERRLEQRRLEGRALAAERVALNRTARAEGGARGAAFARAMSRRALARAEWIQKMGDFANHREELVRRSSSPQTIHAYGALVRDRLQFERSRQRAARGLPPHAPPRIAAITSRADLLGTVPLAAEVAAGERSVGGMEESARKQLEVEPFLMLMRARSQQRGRPATSTGGQRKMPFCYDCLVGSCKGSCSPSRE